MRRPHHDEDRTRREVETEGDAGRFAVDPDSEREAVPAAREAAAPRAGVAVGLKSASRWSLMDSGIDRNRRIRMNAPHASRLPDAPVSPEGVVLSLKLHPVIRLSDDEFFEFCGLNRDLRIERTAGGGITIMPPTGGETSDRNAEITMQLRLWAKRDGTGVTFDSSGAFVLPNGAILSPDAAWVSRDRFAALTAEQRAKFPPLCPDFVVELRSPSDRLPALQSKMQEYIDNGVRLGWLIDSREGQVHVYRSESPVELLQRPQGLSADPLLPGFTLEMADIW